MKKMKVKLGSISDVKEFVALTNSYAFDELLDAVTKFRA